MPQSSSRHQRSETIRRVYDPNVDEARFRWKRVCATKKLKAKRVKSALLLQRVYRGHRVRKWLKTHQQELATWKRVLPAALKSIALRRGFRQ